MKEGKKASDTGFTGVSIIHRLYHLYHFDILHDFLYDVMHTVLLRVVKRHLEYLIEKGLIDNEVEERFSLCHGLQVIIHKSCITYFRLY